MSVELSNVKIDYQSVLNQIGSQFAYLFNTLKNDEEYRQYIKEINRIIISDEQSFVKERDYHEGNLYIVVRFGSATMNFGASQTTISLSVLGTANQIKPTQYFLSLFVSAFNTKKLGTGTEDVSTNISQIWKAPYAATNFNETNKDFRTLFSLDGTLIIGNETAVFFNEMQFSFKDYEWDETLQRWVLVDQEPEVIKIMSYQDGYQASLNPVPFGNTKGFAVSEVDFSTFTFSVSSYLLDSELTKKIMQVRGWRTGAEILPTRETLTDPTHKPTVIYGPNDKFRLSLSFSNDYTNMQNPSNVFKDFKLVNSTINQRLGEIPSITIAFALSGLED